MITKGCGSSCKAIEGYTNLASLYLQEPLKEAPLPRARCTCLITMQLMRHCRTHHCPFPLLIGQDRPWVLSAASQSCQSLGSLPSSLPHPAYKGREQGGSMVWCLVPSCWLSAHLQQGEKKRYCLLREGKLLVGEAVTVL